MFEVLNNMSESKTDLLWAAIVSAIVSAGVSYFFKRRENRHKAEVEYEYEQRKRLRELIGRYHGRLLNAANSLNYRFWNLYSNEGKDWLKMDGAYQNAGYYFASIVYRFLNVCALLRQLENEAIFLDARIADKKDFLFLNYVASLQWVMTDVALFHGLKYDTSIQSDHFFADKFRHYSEICWRNGQFVSFDEFQENVINNPEIERVLQFFDSLRSDENRLRWDRIVAMHLLLLAFINNFGYKRQYSGQDHFDRVAKKMRNVGVLENLAAWLPRHDLDSDKEAGRILKALRKSQALTS